MEIYYFSGTGNSLHVARELKKKYPGAELIPIISTLQNQKVETKAEIVSIVFPIHALTIPWPVKQFLEKVDLKQTTYIYAIATRICFTKVFSDIDKILAGQNRSLDSYFSFEMPESYIPIFQVYSQEKITEVESTMLEGLDSIIDIIDKRAKHRPKDSKKWFLLSHIIYPLITFWFQKIRFPSMEKAFYADSNCNGCGICAQVCLSGKIMSENKKPQWSREIKCTYCFACLHFCPVQSIQIKNRSTVNKGRYHHPAITVNDMVRQKDR